MERRPSDPSKARMMAKKIETTAMKMVTHKPLLMNQKLLRIHPVSNLAALNSRAIRRKMTTQTAVSFTAHGIR
ncbi:MAG: hypothetical protein E6G44_09780 [Actinobacteria bacterium]|nr:MAG: hypothetical protein E6G44_09780 [Actinomycetota bacterium]